MFSSIECSAVMHCCYFHFLSILYISFDLCVLVKLRLVQHFLLCHLFPVNGGRKSNIVSNSRPTNISSTLSGSRWYQNNQYQHQPLKIMFTFLFFPKKVYQIYLFFFFFSVWFLPAYNKERSNLFTDCLFCFQLILSPLFSF